MRARTGRRMSALAVVVAAAALALTGCATTAAPAATTALTSRSDGVSGTITVSAAASLKGAFDEASTRFTKVHPDAHVTISYDGSTTLATQIVGGAPVDVFASADQANMRTITAAHLAAAPVVFARNTLVIVVPKGNPAHVTGLADLARAGLKVVLCAPKVPCGAASRTLLGNAGVQVTPVSDEQNVTAVLTKVANGEADAGLVYTTDARTTDRVQAIVAAGAAAVVNSYPIAALTHAPNPAGARAFVSFITGAPGQEILASFGFEKP